MATPRNSNESYAYARAREEYYEKDFKRVWGTVSIYEDDMTNKEKSTIAAKLYQHYNRLIRKDGK